MSKLSLLLLIIVLYFIFEQFSKYSLLILKYNNYYLYGTKLKNICKNEYLEYETPRFHLISNLNKIKTDSNKEEEKHKNIILIFAITFTMIISIIYASIIYAIFCDINNINKDEWKNVNILHYIYIIIMFSICLLVIINPIILSIYQLKENELFRKLLSPFNYSESIDGFLPYIILFSVLVILKVIIIKYNFKAPLFTDKNNSETSGKEKSGKETETSSFKGIQELLVFVAYSFIYLGVIYFITNIFMLYYNDDNYDDNNENIILKYIDNIIGYKEHKKFIDKYIISTIEFDNNNNNNLLGLIYNKFREQNIDNESFKYITFASNSRNFNYNSKSFIEIDIDNYKTKCKKYLDAGNEILYTALAGTAPESSDSDEGLTTQEIIVKETYDDIILKLIINNVQTNLVNDETKLQNIVIDLIKLIMILQIGATISDENKKTNINNRIKTYFDKYLFSELCITKEEYEKLSETEKLKYKDNPFDYKEKLKNIFSDDKVNDEIFKVNEDLYNKIDSIKLFIDDTVHISKKILDYFDIYIDKISTQDQDIQKNLGTSLANYDSFYKNQPGENEKDQLEQRINKPIFRRKLSGLLFIFIMFILSLIVLYFIIKFKNEDDKFKYLLEKIKLIILPFSSIFLILFIINCTYEYNKIFEKNIINKVETSYKTMLNKVNNNFDFIMNNEYNTYKEKFSVCKPVSNTIVSVFISNILKLNLFNKETENYVQLSGPSVTYPQKLVEDSYDDKCNNEVGLEHKYDFRNYIDDIYYIDCYTPKINNINNLINNLLIIDSKNYVEIYNFHIKFNYIDSKNKIQFGEKIKESLKKEESDILYDLNQAEKKLKNIIYKSIYCVLVDDKLYNGDNKIFGINFLKDISDTFYYDLENIEYSKNIEYHGYKNLVDNIVNKYCNILLYNLYLLSVLLNKTKINNLEHLLKFLDEDLKSGLNWVLDDTKTSESLPSSLEDTKKRYIKDKLIAELRKKGSANNDKIYLDYIDNILTINFNDSNYVIDVDNKFYTIIDNDKISYNLKTYIIEYIDNITDGFSELFKEFNSMFNDNVNSNNHKLVNYIINNYNNLNCGNTHNDTVLKPVSKENNVDMTHDDNFSFKCKKLLKIISNYNNNLVIFVESLCGTYKKMENIDIKNDCKQYKTPFKKATEILATLKIISEDYIKTFNEFISNQEFAKKLNDNGLYENFYKIYRRNETFELICHNIESDKDNYDNIKNHLITYNISKLYNDNINNFNDLNEKMNIYIESKLEYDYEIDKDKLKETGIKESNDIKNTNILFIILIIIYIVSLILIKYIK
jgi:hypothetical protein